MRAPVRGDGQRRPYRYVTASDRRARGVTPRPRRRRCHAGACLGGVRGYGS